jgi:hypothetical protein
VHADEKLTAFLELESAIRAGSKPQFEKNKRPACRLLQRSFLAWRSPNCARLELIEIATCANEIVGNPDVFRYML